MNNTNSTNHSKQLRTWAKIINDCKAAKASGTTVKDWLKTNNISHDTYYYCNRFISGYKKAPVVIMTTETL